MYKRCVAIVVAAVFLLSASTALAQCGCGPVYAPAAPSYTTYYAPTVSYYAPAPHVTYYAPATPYVTYAAPVVQPYVSYYAAPGWTVVRTPRLYVPGQPVRNVLRAVTW
jgi:hypothetical protein